MSELLKKIVSLTEPFGETTARKNELQQAADGYKQVLNEKIGDLKADASKVSKQALVIGGTIVAAYLLLELILPDDDEEETTVKNSFPTVTPIAAQRRNEDSWVMKSLQAVATTTLLAIAKEKLADFLATQKKSNAAENTNTNTES